MSSAPRLQQRRRGPYNDLHRAAEVGSAERVLALLSSGSTDIDQQGPYGRTPLIVAAYEGYSRVVRVLLNKGANVSIGEDAHSAMALHISAQKGYLLVTKMLMEAGADLDARTSTSGCTPLHMAAKDGHSKVVKALIEAGADLNSRGAGQMTPLYAAVQGGHMGAVKLLLRAKANPLLTTVVSERNSVPLDIAAQEGHVEMVRLMIQEVGVEGCGGASGGEEALILAAMCQRVNTMAVLMDAGVVDNSTSLATAAGYGREASVKFLLQQEGWNTCGIVGYVNACDNHLGQPPLLSAICGVEGCYPRIVRLLVDAGADTTLIVRFTFDEGRAWFEGTLLTLVIRRLRQKDFWGKDSAQEQQHRLQCE